MIGAALLWAPSLSHAAPIADGALVTAAAEDAGADKQALLAQGGPNDSGKPGRREPRRPTAASPSTTAAPAAPARGSLRRGQVLQPDQGATPMNDYGRYRLRQPPSGYSWRRVGDRAYLTSDETGLIFEVIPLDH
jgi:Ni/Co efflux regulator RcnB